MNLSTHRLFVPTLLLLLLTAAFLVYLSGLSGDFIFDDFGNIVYNDDVHMSQLAPGEISRATFSGTTTSLSRPVSMLTFALNHYFTGLAPYAFKLTNLFIHLLTCIGLFLLSQMLLKIALKSTIESQMKTRLIALAIVACWALHPVNVSSVLYVVQRMNQLAALSSALALCYYCHIRTMGLAGHIHAIKGLLSLAAFLGLAVLSKENGALLVLFILLVEFFFFRFKAQTTGDKFFLKYYFVLFLALPALLLASYTLVNPEWIFAGYASRDFSAGERLLTESRVLWMYTGWILLPDISQFTFYHDNFPISHNLLSPITTLFSILGLVCALVFIGVFHRRLPLLCFGIAWFYTGHLLEASMLALEPVFEHRNYLPGFGLLFGIIGSVLTLPPERFGPRTAGFLLTFYLIFLAHGTYLESVKWSNPGAQLLQGYEQHPESYRINYSLARFYLQYSDPIARPDFFDLAREHYVKTDQLEPNAIRGLTGIMLVDAQSGRGVSQELIDTMTSRIGTARLDENFIVDLAGLTECQVAGQCPFEADILLGFYNAIPSNTTATDGEKLAAIGGLVSRISRDSPDPILLASLALLRLSVQD